MAIDLNTCLLLANGCTITIAEIAELICPLCGVTPPLCADITTITDCNGVDLGTIDPGDTVTFTDCNGVVLGTLTAGDTATLTDCNGVVLGTFCV